MRHEPMVPDCTNAESNLPMMCMLAKTGCIENKQVSAALRLSTVASQQHDRILTQILKPHDDFFRKTMTNVPSEDECRRR